MNRILTVVAFVFLGLIIFYLTRIDYSENLTSEENQPYLISLMIATVGELLTLIFLSLNKLKKPKSDQLLDELSGSNNDAASQENS